MTEVSCNAVARYERRLGFSRHAHTVRIVWSGSWLISPLVMAHNTVPITPWLRCIAQSDWFLRSSHVYTRSYLRTHISPNRTIVAVPRASIGECVRTCTLLDRLHIHACHPHSGARVIDDQIKLWDGSIRDEAIDFEMLDFVSISSTDRVLFTEGTRQRRRTRYILELWGKLDDRSLCRRQTF